MSIRSCLISRTIAEELVTGVANQGVSVDVINLNVAEDLIQYFSVC